ncbi:hypothetical protein HPC62_07050 [Thermoleptolyngbya sichuanensis A183]|uniref:SLC45 family MFS transporter n=2 Tax=Thermoleptolyngbya TaxID=2303528 RepID=A0A6M8BCF9_9CYAN|nr:MFS transporter [Thermoleptolyngbya sichuanensis]QKD81990.1 hypothetical protein HPC62_07050 [Thermoleptolyngbya sichuanensis A183]
MTSPVGRSPVLWRQVLGLAAVQSAITLMWVMYGAYVPQLLEQFGLPISLGVAIAALENALAIAFQPLMGSLSDRAQRWTGTRFPFIAVGVVLTAALFLAIPGITVLDTGTALRGLMLFVLVAWSLAMTVFHSPVLSLLGHYTTVSHLPLAASFLTVASGIVGTLVPVVNQMILNLGPLATFLVGSTVLLLAAALLRRLDAPVSFTLSGAIATDASPLPSLGSLSFLAAVGLCLGWGAAANDGCGARHDLDPSAGSKLESNHALGGDRHCRRCRALGGDRHSPGQSTSPDGWRSGGSAGGDAVGAGALGGDCSAGYSSADFGAGADSKRRLACSPCPSAREPCWAGRGAIPRRRFGGQSPAKCVAGGSAVTQPG